MKPMFVEPKGKSNFSEVGEVLFTIIGCWHGALGINVYCVCNVDIIAHHFGIELMNTMLSFLGYRGLLQPS